MTGLVVTMLGVVSPYDASAQIGPLPPLPPLVGTTTTTAPPAPGTPPPATPPSTTPSLLAVLTPTTSTTRPVPGPPPLPAAASAPDNGGGDGALPDGVGPFPADLLRQSRSIRRSGPRNTRVLADTVKVLTDLGMAEPEAYRVVFGRFPVKGYATFVHDWWFPRFGPGFRLHLGTDIFATRGTPVGSPTDGVVRLSNGGLGGIAVYVVQDDGSYFYLAHLNNLASGLRDGQRVATGDIVGSVGSTGNAAGGSPHVHFEVHPAPVKIVTKGRGKSRTTTVIPLRVRPGTVLPASDPKPYLDRALQDALGDAPAVVAAYQATRAVPASAGPAPDALPGVARLAGGLPTGLASVARRRAVASDMARVPLFAVAFMLVLLVATLTPVLAPRRARGATPRADMAVVADSQDGPPSPGPTAAAKRTGRFRRRSSSAPSTS